MPTLLNPYRHGATFNPLTIPWHSAFWASGTDFTALGLADAAAVGTFPDEIATKDATQATEAAKPTYRAAFAALNSKPAVDFDGVDDFLVSSAFTSVPQPYTQVIVASVTTLQLSAFAAVDSTTGLRGVAIGTGNLWSIGYGTAVNGSAATTGGHCLFGYAEGANSTLKADGSTVVSGSNAGTTGVAIHRLGGRSSGTTPLAGAIAFYGLLARALTGQEETDLLAWARSFYGTP